MSEEDRSRLYDWFCEQIDKPCAEYLMSCLSPAPLPDLVTKDFFAATLSAELSGYATRADLSEEVSRLESKIDRLFLLREADRKVAKHQFFWLVGTIIAAHGALAGYGIFF